MTAPSVGHMLGVDAIRILRYEKPNFHRSSQGKSGVIELLRPVRSRSLAHRIVAETCFRDACASCMGGLGTMTAKTSAAYM